MLTEKYKLAEEDANDLAAFLLPMLEMDPACVRPLRRRSACSC